MLKGVKILANIKSAKKRIKVAEFKTRRNRMIKSALKTYIKKYEEAVAAKNMELAQKLFPAVVKQIDMSVSKGTLHKNTAARKKSRLAKALKKAV